MVSLPTYKSTIQDITLYLKSRVDQNTHITTYLHTGQALKEKAIYYKQLQAFTAYMY